MGSKYIPLKHAELPESKDKEDTENRDPYVETLDILNLTSKGKKDPIRLFMTFLSLKFLGVCVAADWSGRERLVSKVQAASGWSRYSLRALSTGHN